MDRSYAPRRDYRQRLPAHVTERPPAERPQKLPGDLELTHDGVYRILPSGAAVLR